MQLSYKPLWITLAAKGIKKTDLSREWNISSATVAKMSKDRIVSLNVILKICEALQCTIGEVCEVR